MVPSGKGEWTIPLSSASLLSLLCSSLSGFNLFKSWGAPVGPELSLSPLSELWNKEEKSPFFPNPALGKKLQCTGIHSNSWLKFFTQLVLVLFKMERGSGEA